MNPSKEPADAEQNSSNVSSGLATVSRSYTERLSTWVAANGLYVETTLAVITVGLGALAVPTVTFGLFTALEGETSNLTVETVETVIAVLGFVTLGGLSAVLLVHARVDFRRHGLSFNNDHGALSTVYAMTRAAEAIAAATFLISVLSVIITGIAAESVPDLLPALVGFSAILLPVLVISHGCGAIIRYILALG